MSRLRIGTILAAVVGTLACASTAWGLTAPPLDPAQFSESTEIDNRWFPLLPGTQYIYDGQADRGGGSRPARVVFTVTGVTKVVNGVRTLVVWDRDFYDGALVEEEIHFHAQDDRGNVWSFGEYPEEYEDGVFAGAPATWLSGLEGAQAGIHIQGRPRVGTPPYVQGIAPAVGFFNAARVFATGQRNCIPLACFRKVLVTDEFSPLEPAKGSVYKYYAPGIGAIRVEPAGNPEMEVLTLTSVKRLGAAARAEADARTLALDTHAYEVVPDLYDQTQPAALLTDDDGGDDERGQRRNRG